jgi:4'-phosphopantetheinyl transferase
MSLLCLMELDLDTAPCRWEWLSHDERIRADRFRFEHDRRWFVACRSALRGALAEALGRPPMDLRFVYGKEGKPALGTETWLRFNVAHSGGRALLAISDRLEIGVDIEEICPERATDGVARLVFTDEERAELRAGEFVDTFFALWTRKEAYLKAIGTGFATPNLAIPDDWHVENVACAPGYKAALAYPVEPER